MENLLILTSFNGCLGAGWRPRWPFPGPVPWREAGILTAGDHSVGRHPPGIVGLEIRDVMGFESMKIGIEVR